ncbi:LacI family DNA-binding transcriptional regulator, partial [Lacrimispora sp.]
MTIKEIAQLAGVSISTVSKIVNGKDDSINQKTRERVL